MASSMVHPTTQRLDDPTEKGQGSRSNQAAMNEIFAKGPAVNGYGTEEVRSLGNKLLLGKEDYHAEPDWKAAIVHWGFAPNTTLNYSLNGAPDYQDVLIGPEGLPASPWVPNPMSPGPENGVKPAGQQKAPDGYGMTPTDNWGNGPGVTAPAMSPSSSSQKIKEGLSLGATAGIVNGQGTRSWPNGDAG